MNSLQLGSMYFLEGGSRRYISASIATVFPKSMSSPCSGWKQDSTSQTLTDGLGTWLFVDNGDPTCKSLYVPYGRTKGQRSHPLDEELCDKLLRMMVTWLVMPLKRSIWLQYAKFWKINEADSSLATTIGVRQQGNKRKRLPVKESKAG